MLVPHRFPGVLHDAELIERPNKFLLVCRLGGKTVQAHVPDRGRCLDLLVPGQPVLLSEVHAPGVRKTAFTALLARAKSPPHPWVSLDPAGAPRLVEAALAAGLLPSLRGLRVARREVALRTSRLDLLLEPGEVLCEVKSVGAARDGIALFPDAPTLRGTGHVRLLAARARRGKAAAIVFVAQREDARAVCPDEAIDPLFARALRAAHKAGVRIVGLGCSATREGMALRGELPVVL